MEEGSQSPQLIRFGAFEVDLRAGELRKHGLKIKLQEKPFQLLRTLLEQPGVVVMREELRQKLWSTDIFIEFEHSLNLAVNKLREALGDSAVSPRFVETLPRRGYRFIAPVECLSRASAQVRRSSKLTDSLAVLPFENESGDPTVEYLSDGIAEGIINILSKLSKLRVMANSAMFRYKGKAIDAQSVGRELNVRAVLTGKLLQRDDSLLIRTELVDVANGWHLWGEQYKRKVKDIFGVQEEIAKEICENLRLRLTRDEKKRLKRRDTENTEAYQLYLRGRYCWGRRTAEGFNKGIEYFQQAIEKDPNYGLAYAGLADCYNMLGAFGFGALPPQEYMPRARAAAMRALEIDPDLGEAHASLAVAKFYYDRDWAGTESEFRRAIQLNPSYAIARHYYALYLAAMGRHDEAIAEIKRAQALDPLSLSISATVGRILYFARQYDQAIEQLHKTLEMDPNFFLAHSYLGWVYRQQEMYEEAIAELEKALEVSGGHPGVLSPLGHTYALAGKRAEAQKILEHLTELSKRIYVPSSLIAGVYIGLGEREVMFKWGERACDERSGLVVYNNVEPMLDSLRPDPRFQDHLRRIGFQP